MKKSEKIIVSLVVVAALYGAIDYFVLSRTKPIETAEPQQIDLNAIMSQIASISTSQGSKEIKLSKDLRQPWKTNIFFKNHPDELKAKERKAQDGEEMIQFSQITESFIYSGYLEMDNARIAIINGLDYREGEMVDGFTIDKIKKSMVQLSRQGFLFNITAKNIEKAGTFIDQ